MRSIFVLLVAVLSCTPINTFTATAPDTYPARPDDYPIAVLQDTPSRPHILLGYAECRGESLEEALPYLLKRARMAGGDALLDIKTEQVFAALKDYRAAVIRYTGTTLIDPPVH